MHFVCFLYCGSRGRWSRFPSLVNVISFWWSWWNSTSKNSLLLFYRLVLPRFVCGWLKRETSLNLFGVFRLALHLVTPPRRSRISSSRMAPNSQCSDKPYGSVINTSIGSPGSCVLMLNFARSKITFLLTMKCWSNFSFTLVEQWQCRLPRRLCSKSLYLSVEVVEFGHERPSSPKIQGCQIDQQIHRWLKDQLQDSIANKGMAWPNYRQSSFP